MKSLKIQGRSSARINRQEVEQKEWETDIFRRCCYREKTSQQPLIERNRRKGNPKGVTSRLNKKYSSEVAAEGVTLLLRINTTIVGSNLDKTHADVVYMLGAFCRKTKQNPIDSIMLLLLLPPLYHWSSSNNAARVGRERLDSMARSDRKDALPLEYGQRFQERSAGKKKKKICV